MNKIVLYDDAIGFLMTEKDVPRGIHKKAQEMLLSLESTIKDKAERITSAELSIDISDYLENPTYHLIVYSCEEDKELQQVDFDIKPGTELYHEFKEYALKLLAEILFPL